MRVGIAFTLKPDTLPAGAPDDAHEEFDSPVTITAIADALRQLGHTPVELGDGKQLVERLLADPPEFVFNIAEGTGTSRNREARVPAVCEMLGIPYTGSDPLTLAAALDKDMTRRIVGEAGITLPKGFVLAPPPAPYDGDFAEFPALLEANDLTVPVIAKPVCEGSSKGIRNRCLIERAEDFGPVVAELWANYRQPVLVEEFVAGEEVTVGVVGNDPPEVLGAMRVVPNTATDKFVYSLEVKRNWEQLVTYECPAKLPPAVRERLEQEALAAFEAIGCRDVARIDFRIRDGVPYFIEVNPLPGLNPISSDLILISKAVGVSHAELIRRIFTAAVERQRA
jgi:D-alanine-D-alanine ligase